MMTFMRAANISITYRLLSVVIVGALGLRLFSIMALKTTLLSAAGPWT